MSAVADRGIEGSSLQRIKESEELLAKLYVVEDEVRPVNSSTIRWLLVASVLSVLMFVATLLLRYNEFIVMQEDALSKRGNLEAALQRRDNLFGNLVKLTLNHAALEHAIFSHAADKRAESFGQSGGAGDTASLEKLIQSGGLAKLLTNDSLAAVLGGLKAVVEQYPNIQSAETYKQMMTSLVDFEDKIEKRREEYNGSLAIYNAEITKWPWDYLAKVTGFKKMEYYQLRNDGDTPIITPELFQQLLPLAHVQESKR